MSDKFHVVLAAMQQPPTREMLYRQGALMAATCLGMPSAEIFDAVHTGFLISVSHDPLVDLTRTTPAFFDGALTELAMIAKGIAKTAHDADIRLPSRFDAVRAAMESHLTRAGDAVSALATRGRDIMTSSLAAMHANLPGLTENSIVDGGKRLISAFTSIAEAWGTWTGLRKLYGITMKRLGKACEKKACEKRACEKKDCDRNEQTLAATGPHPGENPVILMNLVFAGPAIFISSARKARIDIVISQSSIRRCHAHLSGADTSDERSSAQCLARMHRIMIDTLRSRAADQCAKDPTRKHAAKAHAVISGHPERPAMPVATPSRSLDHPF